LECGAPSQFSWKYWTDVADRGDPPARFSVDGRFEDGALITTGLPGQTLVSVIKDVEEGHAATIVLELFRSFSGSLRVDDVFAT
jgi:hypothetical protein